MTKLNPKTKQAVNVHTQRDSRRAQKHLIKLTQLLEVSYTMESTECEVEVILKRRIVRKIKEIEI